MFALGCATAKVDVIKAPPERVGKVSLTFKPGPGAERMTEEQQSRLRSTLTSALASSHVTVVSKSEAGVPALDGIIERYEPGNRALRYLVGFGAGKASFASSWRLIEPSGVVVGECRVTGSMSIGGFGGSYDDVLDKVGAQLRGCLGS